MKIHANQKWKTYLVKIDGKQIYKNWRETNLKNRWGGNQFPGAAKRTSRPWKSYFQGRVRVLPAPEKPFSGAADSLTRSWKTHFQGRGRALPAPEKPFSGAADALTRP